MFFITVRTNTSNFTLVTTMHDLIKLLHVLENSSDVIRFKVSDEISYRTQESFGFGNFTKFCNKLYD